MTATAWDRLHPRLTHRAAWLDHPGELPILEGTLIRLRVAHLPGDRDPKPIWLWSSPGSADTRSLGDEPGRGGCPSWDVRRSTRKSSGEMRSRWCASGSGR
ncbi:hypothetical protein LI90_1891 [Carbonactinospora thermoautotrophica]|uniref:Uncharacterized protein n=1 Tax=Carbonactinospora thermoautotrophica TaxID=1469144 RepID=A0A132MSN7_9ACTN|nr:hypothetical protein LI90_1891 [Carbonactinospora thermoautotrophica]